MEQVGLIPSGLTPHTSHCVVVTPEKICYASTLAVYVHRNCPGYPLIRVLNGPTQPILSILCDGQRIIASCVEKKVFFWDLEIGGEPASVVVDFEAKCGAASSAAPGNFFLGGHDGRYMYFKGSSRMSTYGDLSSVGDLCVANVCVKNPNWIGVGTTTGHFLLYDCISRSIKQKVDAFESFRDGGFFSKMFGDSPRITDVAFDPLSDNYCVLSSALGGMILIDIQKDSSVVHAFERSNTGVTQISWIPNQPGSFLTVDGRTNTVRYWNVSSRAPLFSYRPASDPIRTVAVLAPSFDRCVVGFAGGSVGVYNMTLRRLEFQTLPGHCETVFDCRFSHHDKNLLSSCSYDHTIKIWNTKNMQLSASITAGHVVYCVDWSPHGNEIVAAMSNGHVAVYSTSTQKKVWEKRIHGNIAWRVAWCVEEPGLIATCSKESICCVLSANDGTVLRRYSHHEPVFGVCFNPFNCKHIATGCHDGIVRVFDLELDVSQPIKMLRGHQKEVFQVAYNPFIPGIFASGSNDFTVRVWDLESADGNPKALVGHSDKVRGLQWVHVAPYLLVSGCWGGVIRVWDIRSFSCVHSIHHHNADVYCLSSHPQRPLIFVSGSRDTTLRFWKLSMLGHLHIDAAIGIVESSVFPNTAPPRDVLKPDNLLFRRGCGKGIHDLIQKINTTHNTGVDRLTLIADFFEFPYGAADLVNCIKYLGNNAADLDSECEVMPVDVLARIERGNAQKFESVKNKYSSAVGSSQKNAKLISAAESYLRLGEVQKYCELLIEAGEWQRGIAAAPLISVEYWRKLCVSAADKLAAQGDARAVEYYICACEGHKAADFLASQGEFTNAMIVVEQCPQRSERSNVDDASLTSSRSIQLPPQVDAVLASAKLSNFASARAQEYVGRGNPNLAAAAFASCNSRDDCLRMLVRGGSVALAHSVFHSIGMSQEMLDYGFEASMVRSAASGQWYSSAICATRISAKKIIACATVVALYCSCPTEKWVTPEKLIGEYLQIDVQAEEAPQPLYDTYPKQIAYYTIQRRFPVCAVMIASYIERVLATPADRESLSQLQEARDVAGLAVFPEGVAARDFPQEFKRVLCGAYSLGADLARMQGFHSLIPTILTCALFFSTDDAAKDGFKVQIAAGEHFVAQQKKNGGQRDTDGEHNIPPFCTLGDHLPTNGPDGSRAVSFVTNQEIVGPQVGLEDGESRISIVEAMQWHSCCWFSLLATGERLFPSATH